MNPPDPRLDLIQKLNGLLEQEYNSLVQYLGECDPWIPEQHRESIRSLLRELAEEDRRHAGQLVRLILSLEGTPLMGHYTTEVVSLSYLSITYSLRKAVEWKRELAKRYEAMTREFAGRDEVVRILDSIGAEERAHGDRLADALKRMEAASDSGTRTDSPAQSESGPPASDLPGAGDRSS